jgi:hypothetical protein
MSLYLIPTSLTVWREIFSNNTSGLDVQAFEVGYIMKQTSTK